MPGPAPLPPLDPVPAPGAYLARRRTVAGITIVQAARGLTFLPWAGRPTSDGDVARLAARIALAEVGGDPFTAPQAALLSNVFPFDVNVYLELVDLAAAGPDCGLPVPHLCTGCACSFHDPCETEEGPCGWSDNDPARCTACETAAPAPAPKLELVS